MAKDEDEHESRGFKVQDRRRFVDADDRSPAAPEAAEPAREEPVQAAAAAPPADAPSFDADAELEPGTFGEMSFSTFVMGLTTQALMHLGEIPDPVHNDVHHDLPAAKQMIDLLGILRDKTKGNLDPTEEQLLGEMLYDLRMRYVEVARSR
jgi:hypothetical protein